MALRVQLREQVRLGATLHAQSQRRRASRRLEAHGLDLADHHAELVAHRSPDGLPPRAAHVDMCRTTPAVHDREHLVGRVEAERRDRDRNSQRDAEEHVAGMVNGQVQAGQGQQPDDRSHDGLGIRPSAAGHHQAVHRADEEDGQHGDRRRRSRVPTPVADDRDPEGAWPRYAEVDQPADDLQQEHAAHEHPQVPPAAEGHGQAHRGEPDDGGSPAGAYRVDGGGCAGQPGRPELSESQEQPRISPVPDPMPGRACREGERPDEEDHREDEPHGRADGERVRQRWRCTRRSPLASRSLEVAVPGGAGWGRTLGRDGGAGCPLAHGTPSPAGTSA